MKHIFLLLIFFFVFQTQAQKITNKFISSEGIRTLIIEGNTVFKISIETTQDKNISIQSYVEGENNEQVILLTDIKNNQLIVSSAYQPLFVAEDDKLSANKLISIEFKIRIPELLNVFITSNIASVFMSGNYNQVTSELLNGSFNTKDFNGNLLVNTIHGDIVIETKFGEVKASSKHGIVEQEALTPGNQQIQLNSINGDVRVTKTE